MENTKTKKIATHIGHDVFAFGTPALPIRDEDGNIIGWTKGASLTLMSADGSDEGAYFPPQSIVISGTDSILQLRDFCDALLEPESENQAEPKQP